ncbi:BRCA2 family protein [Cryptosporidium muris RN66]|uniref:BRCA2 family protein n=1 Tax=Cryptosporidium muris (strain RN66) TaxID=441375 RepID=B6AJ29_CRYMR|nr:BRCA2 family protein [Cryptosporidium muris RN66]EEA08220.1 BRCA2 family protein [Cryptosporidium muris RN66]|eukprot:XP_002142569.1 BRCA2 family protein [Cryptosporidium muris RN66]
MVKHLNLNIEQYKLACTDEKENYQSGVKSSPCSKLQLRNLKECVDIIGTTSYQMEFPNNIKSNVKLLLDITNYKTKSIERSNRIELPNQIINKAKDILKDSETVIDGDIVGNYVPSDLKIEYSILQELTYFKNTELNDETNNTLLSLLTDYNKDSIDASTPNIMYSDLINEERNINNEHKDRTELKLEVKDMDLSIPITSAACKSLDVDHIYTTKVTQTLLDKGNNEKSLDISKFSSNCNKQTSEICSGYSDVFLPIVDTKTKGSQTDLLEARTMFTTDGNFDNIRGDKLITSNINNSKDSPQCLFSTGSGKKININETSIIKAKKMLNTDNDFDDNFNNNKLTTSNINNSKDSSHCLFSTGSGKKVNINETSIIKAKKILNTDNDFDDNFNNNKLTTSNINNSKDSSQCLFSTGSGKKININETSITKARSMFGYTEDELSTQYKYDKHVNLEFQDNIIFSLRTLKETEDGNKDNIKNLKILNNGSSKDLNIEYPEYHTDLSNSKDLKYVTNQYLDIRQSRKITIEDLKIPLFYPDYQIVRFAQKHLEASKPTLILMNPLKNILIYEFILEKRQLNNQIHYRNIGYQDILKEFKNFIKQYPIFPKAIEKYIDRWFNIQYLIVLYTESRNWIRNIKQKLKMEDLSELKMNKNCFKKLFFSIDNILNFPSAQKVFHRICKRAICEFFKAKRSAIVKICEGDISVSVPLALKVLTYEQGIIDGICDNSKVIFTCTDGWYLIKICCDFGNLKCSIKTFPSKIFICGSTWKSNVELGHPLEIEYSIGDIPTLNVGLNLIRPLTKSKSTKLGFHISPLIFRLHNLFSTIEYHPEIDKNSKNDKMLVERGAGLSFLTQLIVLYKFPICYKEIIDRDDDNRRVSILRDEVEMDWLNDQTYQIMDAVAKGFSQNSIENMTDFSTRKINIECRVLVMDYWKFQKIDKLSKKSDSLKINFDLSEYIPYCSLLTLPSGISLDDIYNIKIGSILRFSWLRVHKYDRVSSHELNYSLSRLFPTSKTSFRLLKLLKNNQTLSNIVRILRIPVLSDPLQNNMIVKYSGWPYNLLGLLLYTYPVDERRRNFQQCFEFRILLVTSNGSKVFVRFSTVGNDDSQKRMCYRLHSMLQRYSLLENSLNYTKRITFLENLDFHSYEKSTGLFFFIAKVPYINITVPYVSHDNVFSNISTQHILSEVIEDLIAYTSLDIPKLFEYRCESKKRRGTLCATCGVVLTNCTCTLQQLQVLEDEWSLFMS